MKVLVIGDSMLDILRAGSSTRTSPEDANCQIVTEEWTQDRPGGAANVAAWLAGVHGWTVTLACHYASDAAGWRLEQACSDANIQMLPYLHRHHFSGDRGTTRKERVAMVSKDGQRMQHLARLDVDTDYVLQVSEFSRLENHMLSTDYDAIVVADYGKGIFDGVWGDRLREEIGKHHARIPIVVNSKHPDNWRKTPMTVLICNAMEAARAWPHGTETLSMLGTEALVVTMGNLGVALWFQEGMETHEIIHPSMISRPVDVTGAGDAFTAGLVYGHFWMGAMNVQDRRSEWGGRLHHGLLWAGHCCEQVGVGKLNTEMVYGPRRASGG